MKIFSLLITSFDGHQFFFQNITVTFYKDKEKVWKIWYGSVESYGFVLHLGKRTKQTSEIFIQIDYYILIYCFKLLD